MAVVVTPSAGSSYTWAGSTWTWADARASLATWGTAYPLIYDVQVTEAVNFAELNYQTFAQSLVETLTTLDTYVNSFQWSLNVAEAVAFAEVHKVTFGQSIQELINTLENFSTSGTGYLNFSETLSFGDSLSENYGKFDAESVAFAELEAKQYSQALSELIATAEVLGNIAQFYLNVAESVATSDVDQNAKLNNFLEAFSLQEVLSHAISKNIDEAVAFAETLPKDISNFMNEAVTFADANGKAMTMKISEAISLIETYVRKANATYSNMVLNSNDLTQAAFDDLVDNGKVIGFDRFRDFIPGNYTYQKAMFRTILQSINDDRARLSALKVTVDVPDIFDRGAVTIATGQTAGVAVTFNRPFHIVPEITVTLKGGTTISIPVVSSPTVTGFTVMLKDPTTNTGVTGTLSWAAHGY